MRLSQRDRIMLLVLAAGIVLFAAWWLAIKPAGADAQAARSDLQSVQSQLAGARAELAQTSSTHVSRAKRTAITVKLSKATPPAPRIPEALVELQRTAVRSRVTITAITGGDAVTISGVSGSPLTVEVDGSFFEVDDFLYRLQNLVKVNGGGLHVGGRLFALGKADIGFNEEGTRPGDVKAVLNLVAISSGPSAADAAATTTPTGTATP
jgi:type IV pilus assembly protein PilO